MLFAELDANGWVIIIAAIFLGVGQLMTRYYTARETLAIKGEVKNTQRAISEVHEQNKVVGRESLLAKEKVIKAASELANTAQETATNLAVVTQQTATNLAATLTAKQEETTNLLSEIREQTNGGWAAAHKELSAANEKLLIALQRIDALERAIRSKGNEPPA